MNRAADVSTVSTSTELPEPAGNRGFRRQGGANGEPIRSGAEAMPGPADLELQAVIRAWPRLPEAEQAGIMAMVRAATGKPE